MCPDIIVLLTRLLSTIDVMYLELTAQFLGFLGAVLLYCFGLPPQVRPDGASFLRLEQDDEEEKAKAKLYRKIGRFGLSLVITSFALQFVSTIIKN
jgi:hypothetical protein